ncbi:MAG: citramalate synthase [Elusimicrobia bacterium RIFOXYC2_FULL_34_12]|nr:MAG: citramalate synthase [Elusimicrobia bacterium RIFOXYC2_FULL_34_12]HAM38098.1 citramalate synthase [Elusimicrobiota bacterium]
MNVNIFDTTLRDGTQGEGISLTVDDKLRIASALDDIGIHYIEGGWPYSNPKDIEFFKKVKKLKLNAKITAFGSTRHKDSKPEKDGNLLAIVNIKPDCACIFGKAWDLHVSFALNTTLEKNLDMIYSSVKFLKSKNLEVIFDAEHFFNGFESNPDYALEAIKSAVAGGADIITLCDTNGGMLPNQVKNVVEYVKNLISVPLGIHAHNDSGCAVANSIIAVQSGCTHIQGTLNGWGERCGNASLSSIIPNLKLKLGIDCIASEKLKLLTETSRYISEIANVVPSHKQPYIGYSAFAHKGGIHASAVAKKSSTYEHINPSLVGNQRRILISELSGRANILLKSKELNIDFEKDTDKTKKILQIIKEYEKKGYSYEGAEGSFELLVKKHIGKHKTFFDLGGFRVAVEKDKNGNLKSEATIKVFVKNKEELTAAEGDGPVNALDNALRKALDKFYPQLKNVRLSDFKVRIINPSDGTGAKVRVLIQSTDGKNEWNTVGVSENIIEASWQALVDSIEYKLLKE